MKRLMVTLLLTALAMAGCASSSDTLRLATTTSTYDSGLLDAILPVFEAKFGVNVEVVAVGTGQALSLGEAGDADVVLVHARAREDAFVAAGYAPARFDVMYNDFVIVGPEDDPVGIGDAADAVEAFRRIAAAQARFASRGDESGTNFKELSIWEAAGITPEGDWYDSIGQGMGSTLEFSQETGSYTLTDRGTFIAQQANLEGMAVLFGGDTIDANPDLRLLNPYGVMPVNGDNDDLAMDFVEWLTSVETQQAIADFRSPSGEPLFFPDSVEWRSGGG
ncbi:MAG: substrate-binding domain-containing protein [Acidimicrobiia bacterium]|jgi:tungstate transport system substrate-binding protein|nr:MAG: substrate-binding domain-containing protein [Acidimicrobiia bacterium]